MGAKMDRDIAWDMNVADNFASGVEEVFKGAESALYGFIFGAKYLNGDYNDLPEHVRCGLLKSAINTFTQIESEVVGKDLGAGAGLLGKEAYALGKQCDQMLCDNVRELKLRLSVLKSKAKTIKDLLVAPDIMAREAEIGKKLKSYKGYWDQQAENLQKAIAKMSEQYLGIDCYTACYSEDPVNLSTGNFVYDKKDLAIKGEYNLCFHRFYNSMDRVKGSLGRCFTHNYEMTAEVEVDSYAVIRMSDGQRKNFIFADGKYVSDGLALERFYINDDTYVLESNQGVKHVFDKDGKLIRIENRFGRGISFAYLEENGEKYLSKATADDNTSLSYRYEDGLLVEVFDNAGRKIALEYSNKRLNKVTNASGYSYSYVYSENGRITEITNARDVVSVVNVFDEKNRVVHQDFPDGGSMDFEYDDEAGVVTLKERNDSVIKYVHDEYLRNTDIIYEDGTSVHNEYNNRNLLVSTKDRNGNITRFAYDDRGNTTQQIDPDGTKTSVTYNADNKIISVKINGKCKIKNSYDSNGNIISTLKADGSNLLYKYDDCQRVVEIVYPDNTKQCIEYDAKGNVTKVKRDVEINYQYDELNRVIATTDGNGNISRYEYNNADKIVKAINPLGAERKYEYNGAGKVTKYSDYDGNVVEVSYNSIGKVETFKDKEGNETSYEYDKMWNVSCITNPNGGKIVKKYNSDNRLESITSPEGGIVSYKYDANGNAISITDQVGNCTRYVYDSKNRIVEIIDPKNLSLRIERDDEGRITKEINAKGMVTYYTYDELGRCTSVTNARGEKESYVYDEMDRKVQIIYPNGAVRRYEYVNGKVSKVIATNGTYRTYEYDNNGNCILVCDNDSVSNSLEYDCLNRVVKIVNAEMQEIRYVYDSFGKPVEIINEVGDSTKYTYTQNGKLSSVTDVLGNVTKYTYDCMGNLILIEAFGVDSNGKETVQKTSFEWNLEGKLLKKIDALGKVESYEYDKAGRMISKLDRDNYVTKYGYDSRNIMNNIVYADGSSVELLYDELRMLKEIKDSTGSISIMRDDLGRIIKTTDAKGASISYEWGKYGEKSSMTYADGKKVIYSYDEAGRLVGLETGSGTVSYSYDEFGRLCNKNMPNGINTLYRYNDLGKISQIIHKGENLYEEYNYEYDVTGNNTVIDKIRTEAKDSGRFTYGYDKLGRLINSSRDGKLLKEYEYDAFGNRTVMRENDVTATYVYNANNQLMSFITPDQEENYEYDNRGNLIKILNSSGATKEFEYDATNHMASSVSILDGISKKAEYSYNGLGFRTSQEIYSYDLENKADGILEKKFDYTVDLTKQYHNLLQLTEVEGNNSKTKNFYWDYNVISMDEAGIESYYVQDSLGSPMDLLDNNGHIMESYAFDDFGQSETVNSKVQPFGYVGHQMEEVSGMYFAQARRYDARHGRFTGEDLVQGNISMPGTLNRYHYCLNKPMDMVDINGRNPFLVFLLFTLAAGTGVALTGCESTKEIDISEITSPADFIDGVTIKDLAGGEAKFALHTPETLLGVPNPEEAVSGLKPLDMSKGNLMVLDPDYYNVKEFCFFTNCYAFATGNLFLPYKFDDGKYRRFAVSGVKPSQFNPNPLSDEKVKALYAGTPESDAMLVKTLQGDMEPYGYKLEPYEEGMEGGIKIAVVVRTNEDIHFYRYNESDETWWNKNGMFWATNNYAKLVSVADITDKQLKEFMVSNNMECVPLYATGQPGFGGLVWDEIKEIKDFEDAMKYVGYDHVVGVLYLTRIDGKCIE